MKNITKISTALIMLILFSCSSDNISNESADADSNSNFNRAASTVSYAWDFSDLTDWSDASQNSPQNYYLENGNLHMFTDANTWERVKVKSNSTYGTGTYSWNIFVPTMGTGDMTSIGAFLYCDDTHELDFEIGYGSQSVRQNLGAQADDLVVYMSSQGNPAISVKKLIKSNQWYTLTMEVSASGSKYFVNWKINDIAMASSKLNYGNKKFRIFCSVENLQFMGDHIPQIQNYALFNSVQYTGF